MKNKIFLGVLFSIILMSLVSSYMPPTHLYVNGKLTEFSIDSELFRQFKADPALAYAGNILVDFSLIYGYYTESGGLKYAALHDGAFCEAMLQQSTDDVSLSCSIGACLHLTQDIQSHTEMVTHSITHTGLPNSLVHTLSEQHLDLILQERSPDLKNRALNVSRFYECKPIYKKVLTGIDLYKEDVSDGVFDRNFDKFIDEVSGSVTSYDLGFRKLGTGFDNLRAIPFGILATYILFTLLAILSFFLLLFRKGKNWINWLTIILLLPIIIILVWLFIANLQGNAFVTFVKFISPISRLVPIGDPDAHINTAIANGRNFLLQGERAIINVHASGFTELAQADSKVKFLNWIFIGVLFIGIALLVWANLRKKKTSNFNF